MAGLLMVRVHLDWTDPAHYERGVSLPCRVCGTLTCQRDGQGRACEKTCAEDEIARELLGTGQALIADERVPAPAAFAGGRLATAGGPQ
ncbi:hypothetical protein ACFYPF_26130 [Micromonospora sp. NPDC005223]|uniref:hypothetical protein n=1 Tax=Micromonospora sp. NPDC005223 TaxID=3364227 RepID=UPI0036CE2233